jgi:hypothetical protein
MLVRHRPAVPSRPARPRGPAKSRSAPGRCATTTCVRDGGADNTGCRRAPVGLRQTGDHPSARVTKMGEGIAVPQKATPGTAWLPNPPEQAGFMTCTRLGGGIFHRDRAIVDGVKQHGRSDRMIVAAHDSFPSSSATPPRCRTRALHPRNSCRAWGPVERIGIGNRKTSHERLAFRRSCKKPSTSSMSSKAPSCN